jgi:hypothetical protein
MPPILVLAAAFAAIIVAGTVAAWLHDAAAARLGAPAATRSRGRQGARRRRAAVGDPATARVHAREGRPARRPGPAPVAARRAGGRAGAPPAPARPVVVRARPLS